MQKPRQRIDNRGIPRKPEGRGGGGVAVAEVDREEEEQIERKRRYIGPTFSPPPPSLQHAKGAEEEAVRTKNGLRRSPGLVEGGGKDFWLS